MRGDFLLCVVLAVPLCALGQASDSPRLAGKLVISGSSTMAPMIGDMAARFRAIHPAVAITVEAGGSGRGVSEAREGKAGIGMVARELNADEKDLFAVPIARDGIAFVVHKTNTALGLTRAQALDVFTGKIRDWKALGAPSAPIEVVTRAPGYSSLELASHYLGIAPEAIRAAHTLRDNADLLPFIAGRPNAIGFVSIGAAENAAQERVQVKTLVLDGVIASSGAVRDGTWPIARTLNLVTRQVPTGLARAFVEFALSPASRSAILDHDYVPY